MSAANDLDKQREQLATDIQSIKRNIEDNGGKLTDLERKIAGVEETTKKLRQFQEAFNREQLESGLGSADELRAYQVAPDDAQGIDAHNRSAYVQTDQGAVQLTGHTVRHVIPDRPGEYVEEFRWGMLDDPNPRSIGQLQLQRMVTKRNVARALGLKVRGFSPGADRQVRLAALACGGQIERIFSDTATGGGTWIPDTTLPELQRKILVPSNAAAVLPRREIPPGGTVRIPILGSDIRVYKKVVPTGNRPPDATLSDLTMTDRAIDTISGVAATEADREALADSILPYADRVLQLLAEAYQFAEDDSLFNGDTAATHQDAIASWDNRGRLGGTSGLGTGADHRTRWPGLRARAADLQAITSRGATDQNSAQTWDGLRAALGKLGADNLAMAHMAASGGNQGGVVVWTSWEYFFSKMLDFDEFATWEKVGMAASILTGMLGDKAKQAGGMLPGQVGFVSGFIPVCIAYPIAGDFASTGLYTGSGSTTGMIQCDTSRMEYCFRSGLTTETVVNPMNDTVDWVTRFRTLVDYLDAVAAGVFDTHWSYNLTY